VSCCLITAAAASKRSNRAALCVSGQLRTFTEAYESLAPLRAAFGGADVFLYVSRSKDDVKANALDAALAAVAPVAVEYYDQDAYEAEAPRPGPCHRNPAKDPLRHFSYHGAQFWGVGKCFDLIKAHERKTGRRYAWAARLRPDQRHGDEEVAAVSSIVSATRDVEAKRVWYRRKKQSDAFALMTRGALVAYASIWRDEFRDGKCVDIGLDDMRDQRVLKRTCAPLGLNYRFSTECMVTAHLVLRERVNVTGDDALAPVLVRPYAVAERVPETAEQRAARLRYKAAISMAKDLSHALTKLNYSAAISASLLDVAADLSNVRDRVIAEAAAPSGPREVTVEATAPAGSRDAAAPLRKARTRAPRKRDGAKGSTWHPWWR